QRTARQSGPMPVGVWHSHPGGSPQPSAWDAAGVTDPEWVWLIAAGDMLAAFLPDASQPDGFRPLPILDGSAASL
ncbi:MAG: Mov34/MPN/PAD-1 family protein, partial [Sphingomonadaceae bacterium]